MGDNPFLQDAVSDAVAGNLKAYVDLSALPIDGGRGSALRIMAAGEELAVEGEAAPSAPSAPSASWTVAATAICADPLPGREVVSAVSPLNSQTKVIGAACPVGKLALGGGVFTSSMSCQP